MLRNGFRNGRIRSHWQTLLIYHMPEEESRRNQGGCGCQCCFWCYPVTPARLPTNVPSYSGLVQLILEKWTNISELLNVPCWWRWHEELEQITLTCSNGAECEVMNTDKVVVPCSSVYCYRLLLFMWDMLFVFLTIRDQWMLPLQVLVHIMHVLWTLVSWALAPLLSCCPKTWWHRQGTYEFSLTRPDQNQQKLMLYHNATAFAPCLWQSPTVLQLQLNGSRYIHSRSL